MTSAVAVYTGAQTVKCRDLKIEEVSFLPIYVRKVTTKYNQTTEYLGGQQGVTGKAVGKFSTTATK